MLPVSASLFHPLTDSFIVFTSRVHWRAWWWISTITAQGYSPSPLIGNPRTVARMINVWSWPKALGELSFACLSSDIYSYSVAFSYKKVSWILRCTRNILSGGKPSLLIKSEYLYKVQWIRDLIQGSPARYIILIAVMLKSNCRFISWIVWYVNWVKMSLHEKLQISSSLYLDPKRLDKARCKPDGVCSFSCMDSSSLIHYISSV